jgi:predicted nucleic acid-binding protein
MDFADATIVAASERLNIKHVFTLDRKDFSIYRPLHATHFQLLPLWD